MAQKSLIVVCLGLMVTAACSNQPANQQQSSAPVSGPAAAIQANSYQGVGVVKSLNPKRPGIEIDHEEVVGLMPAMQMEFPVTDVSLLNGLAVNDKIDFTIVDNTGEMKITAIKKR
jgi:Cu/Ag efflux protein CusF